MHHVRILSIGLKIGLEPKHVANYVLITINVLLD
jgi:hypothetical protein